MAGDDIGCAPPLEVATKECAQHTTIVTIYARRDRAESAANALRPVNDAARRDGEPEIAFDREPLC